MISFDTLRADRVGRYGGGDLTPFLDGLLAEGVTLEDHASCSNWTYASVTCALGGRRHGEFGPWLPRGGPRAEPSPVPEEIVFLADQLEARGYTTGLVAANFLFGEGWNLGEEYDRWRVDLSWGADDITPRALEVLDQLRVASDQPWFLHLHYIDPHQPYDPPAAYREGLADLAPIPFDLSTVAGAQAADAAWGGLSAEEQALLRAHAEALYGGAIRFMDDHIADLFARLDGRGALEDALVVIWSDHGEQLWDHDRLGHAKALYAEETRALGGFWARGLAPGAYTGASEHRDLAPTFMDALGLDVPENFTGAILGAAAPPPRTSLFLSGGDILQSIEAERRKLIYSWDGRVEYYDLAADPGERVDRFELDDPDIIALFEVLRPEIERVDALYPEATPIEPRLESDP